MKPFTKEEYLAHYGVLGMKWGVRKDRATRAADKIARREKRQLKKLEKAEKKRQKILKNPTKLYANRKKFTKSELDKAMQEFAMDQKLKNFSVDQLGTASKYAATILAYGTIGATAYKLATSPAATAAMEKFAKLGGNGPVGFDHLAKHIK